MSNIIAAVVAAEKVGPEVHVIWLAVMPSLRQAQAERGWCLHQNLGYTMKLPCILRLNNFQRHIAIRSSPHSYGMRWPRLGLRLMSTLPEVIVLILLPITGRRMQMSTTNGYIFKLARSRVCMLVKRAIDGQMRLFQSW